MSHTVRQTPAFWLCGLALWTLATLAQPAIAAPIALTSNDIHLSARDDLVLSTDAFSGTALPTSTARSVVAGASRNTTGISLSETTNNAVFDFSFDHAIDNTGALNQPGAGDFASSFNNGLDFTAQAALTFSVTGSYSLTGPAGARVFSDVFLQDLTTGATLFRDRSESRATANDAFVLGLSGDGDYDNFFTGSLTGVLVAGHDYRFFFSSALQSLNAADEETEVAASATGNATLALTAVSPVDSPTTLAILCAGLAGMGIRRRKG